MKHYEIGTRLMDKSTRDTYTIAATEWRVTTGGLQFVVTLADGREICGAELFASYWRMGERA
jgi:hypothetical protein